MKRYGDSEDKAPHILDIGKNEITSPFQSPVGSGHTAGLNIVIKKINQNQCHKHNLSLLAGD